jgi:hypothetical protein
VNELGVQLRLLMSNFRVFSPEETLQELLITEAVFWKFFPLKPA